MFFCQSCVAGADLLSHSSRSRKLDSKRNHKDEADDVDDSHLSGELVFPRIPAKIASNSKAHHSAHCIKVPGTASFKNSFMPSQLKDDR